MGVEYLIIGGGGGGGGAVGGGGGAGAFVTNVGGARATQSAGTYAVTVGAGGAGGTGNATRGSNGGNSSVFGLTAIGGGGGGTYFGNQPSRQNTGSSGGSGGGSAADDMGNTSVAGGTRVTAGQGNNGGAGYYADFAGSTNRWRGGGGGGAGSAGESSGSAAVGNGGSGLSSSITGSAVTYAAGGGGGSQSASSAGGSGIGGAGGYGNVVGTGQGGNGTAGTGSGGGGNGLISGTGGSGGSGIVVVRYRATEDISGGGDTSGAYTDAGVAWRFERFTASGTLTLSHDPASLRAMQSGVISGSGRLTYAGAGTLVLAAANTYSGGTLISSGTLQVGNGGLVGALGSGNVTNNAVLVFSRSDSLAVANAISGTGAVRQVGGGTTTLTGSNTYAGGTLISSGTLQVGNGGAAGTLGPGNVVNDATLAFNRSDTHVVANAISGSGALVHLGGTGNQGTAILTGANTYAGATTVSGGALQVGHDGVSGTLGSGQVSVASGAYLVFRRSNSLQVDNVISGAGQVQHYGAGTLILAGSNDYSGVTTIASGILQVGNGGAAGSLGSGNVVNNATLAFNRSDNIVLSNALSGTGSLRQSGSGTLTIAGSASHVGGTSVESGTLELGAANRLADTGALLVVGGVFSLGGFSDTVGSVTLSGGSIANGTLAASAFTLQAGVVSAVLAGSGALAKTGAGVVTLSGANTYTGGTTVSAGRLVGDVTSLRGSIANDAQVEFLQAAAGTYSGSMSGSGSLIKSGSGALTLAGANTFAGALSVEAGSLATSGAGRLAAAVSADVASGTTLSLGGDQTLAVVTGAGTLDLASGTLSLGAGSGEFSGVISGPGALAKVGAGTLTLSGANTFTGTVGVSGGTLVLDNDQALNTSNDVTLLSGGTLSVATGRTVLVKTLTLANGTLTGLGVIKAVSATVDAATLAAVIEDTAGAAANLVKTGSGTTTVTSANTFTGLVDIQSGVLELGTGGSFASASSLQLATGATLRLEGRSQGFAALNGTGGAIDLGTGGALGVAGAGTYAGSISGAGSLAKTGVGNLVLSGTNTYTGATSVSGGRLSVNGSLASSAVTVQSGGTLGGSGSIAGAVTVQSGATLAPGNSPGTLLTGNLTVEGLVDIEMAGLARGTATGYDSTEVTGSVTLGATSQLNITLLNGFEPERDAIFFLIVNDGTDAVTGTFSGLDQGDIFLLGGMRWQISYVANYTGEDTDLGVSLGTFTGGNDVALVAVPEPSTYGLLLGALALAAAATRRRKKTD